jgi:hypothetical protein
MQSIGIILSLPSHSLTEAMAMFWCIEIKTYLLLIWQYMPEGGPVNSTSCSSRRVSNVYSYECICTYTKNMNTS